MVAKERWCVFTLLWLSFFLTSCGLTEVKEKSVYFTPIESKSAHFLSGRGGQFINIAKLYDQLSPRQSDFDALFKLGLSDVAYRQYFRLLEEKLTFHRRTKRFYEVSLLSKERIWDRQSEMRKEWVWGKHRKMKLLEYYGYFRQPAIVYEHKVAYRMTPFNDKGVTDPSPQKTIATEKQYVLYFYKQEGNGKVFLIDPDIFIQGIL